MLKLLLSAPHGLPRQSGHSFVNLQLLSATMAASLATTVAGWIIAR